MRLVLALIAIFSFTASFAQKPELHESDQRIGNIESITYYKWDGDTTGEASDVNTVFYDETGKAIKAQRKEKGYFTTYLDLSFVKDTLISEEKYTQKNDEEYIRYTYDSQGRVTSERHSVKGGGSYYFLIEYTYSDYLTIKEKFNAFKEFNDYREYYKNSDGLDSAIIKKSDKGKIIQREIKYYDDEGNDTLSITYAKKGKKVLYRSTDRYINDSTSVYASYDGKGVQRLYLESVYNSKDLLMSLIFSGSLVKDPIHYTYEYLYDETGNWIQRICSEGDKIVFLEKREIVYGE